MSNSPDDSSGPRQHLVEVGVAAVMALLGVITVIGSLQVGIGWGAEGPKSGFFPFWIGLIVIVTSLYNLVRAYTHGSRKLFASWMEIAQVPGRHRPQIRRRRRGLPCAHARIAHVGIPLAESIMR